MTTGELIKQLQEADPEGNLHVRIAGECPVAVERKPGYWDGRYSCVENGKFHVSTEGDKIDIHTMDLELWLLDNKPDTVVTHLYDAALERFEKELAKILLTME